MESAMDCAALRWREHPRIMVQRVRSQQWPSVAEAGGGALAIKLSDGHRGAAVGALRFAMTFRLFFIRSTFFWGRWGGATNMICCLW